MAEVTRQRPLIAGRVMGPGPGHYALPPTVGYINHDYTKLSSPAFSFHRRMSSKMVSEDSSPGPRYHVDGKITRFGRDGTPSYSMLGRKKPGAQTFQTPGPGAYSPERVPPVNLQRQPPSFTMAFRTRYRSVDAVPAPNRYTLPNLLGSRVPNKPSSASYSMSRRVKTGGPTEDLATTPGPAHYRSTDPSIYLNKQPSFSIQSRHTVLGDATLKPGPGTHYPEKVNVHLPKPPSFTMGVRHSEFVTPLVINVTD
ncbi:outer dense fiber protein 3-like protein 2a [Trichomycterus rosablanca]|uniref:outer dense fiber protein 3-like protein 2a n=1 Tax=Trichomycterus rosablanca TaxID=2290929 RepID=UPI002F35B10E